MAKVRVYELAKELGLQSRDIMTALEEMGEFVRSASSTVDASTMRMLKEKLTGQQSARSDAHAPVSSTAGKPLKAAGSSRPQERPRDIASSSTDVEPEDLTRVSRKVASLIARSLEERLLNTYGRDWLSVVNQRRTSQGMNPMKSLSDHRACFWVFIHDPVADGWVSRSIRENVRTLLRLANRAAHNEPLSARDLEVAQSILQEFRNNPLNSFDEGRQARPVPGPRVRRRTVGMAHPAFLAPTQEEHEAVAAEAAADAPTHHFADAAIDVDQLARELGIDRQVVISQLLRRGKNAQALMTYDDWLNELVPLASSQ